MVTGFMLSWHGAPSLFELPFDDPLVWRRLSEDDVNTKTRVILSVFDYQFRVVQEGYSFDDRKAEPNAGR